MPAFILKSHRMTYTALLALLQWYVLAYLYFCILILYILMPPQQDGSEETGLSVENTLWANTVVAAGTATGIVIYTGCETRSVMNNSQPRSKVGLLDMEINGLTKVALLHALSETLNIYIYLLAGAFWCRFGPFHGHDDAEGFQRSLVSLHVSFCLAIFLHHSD